MKTWIFYSKSRKYVPWKVLNYLLFFFPVFFLTCYGVFYLPLEGLCSGAWQFSWANVDPHRYLGTRLGFGPEWHPVAAMLSQQYMLKRLLIPYWMVLVWFLKLAVVVWVYFWISIPWVLMSNFMSIPHKTLFLL